MSSRRIIILIAALAMGVLAAVGLMSYINGVESAAEQDTATQTVWVVAETIPRGTPAAQVIDGQLIVERSIPVEFWPATAIGNPQAELAGFVAVSDLPANTIVVQGQFVAPSVVSTGVTDRLEEADLVTVSFSLDQVSGAAYMIEPGDFVNILTRTDVAGGEATADGDYDRTERLTYSVDARYLYQKAQVLAVDTNLTPDLGDSAATDAEGEEAAAPVAVNSGLITLAVPPEAVQRILGVGLENIYLSLVPTDYVPREMPPLELAESVMPGEDAERLTPYVGVETVAPANDIPEPAADTPPAAEPTTEPEEPQDTFDAAEEGATDQ